MEFFDTHQPEEIVLTYRPDPAAAVELRYERELPERMRRELSRRESHNALDQALQSGPVLPAAARRRGRRGLRLAVALALLTGLICLGVGLWYLGEQNGGIPGGGPPAGGELPEDGFLYPWDQEAPGEEPAAETTIDTYRPFGGSVAQLELVPAGEDRAALSPGEIYERVRLSTVTVLGLRSGSTSVGTGIVFTSDGYLLTNYHVIAGCQACEVWITDAYGVDAVYDALLVGGDADQDLAVLKVEAKDLTPAEFGVSDQLRIGDPVYAIGNPLGLELRSTFTDGIVSAIDREVDVDGVSMTLLQTNAALNSGNSGGPLINQYGQVVGINTIKMMSGYDTIEGLGFAIPTSLAVRWVNEIIQTGKIAPQPVLGLSINRIPETLPDGTVGLRIEEVVPGGSGELAGVQVGDYLVAFNGETVTRTEQVLVIRRQLRVGDEVPIRLWRDGELLELTMVMQAPAD